MYRERIRFESSELLDSLTNPFGCGKEEFGCAKPQILVVIRFKSTGGHGGPPVQLNLIALLEVQFQTKLELTRVEGSCRAAIVAAIARALIEQSHVVDKRRGSSFVEAVK